MSKKQKKKDSGRLKNRETQKSLDHQEYNLDQSFSKLRQYSRHAKNNSVVERTCSDEEQSKHSHRDYANIGSDSFQCEEKTTGLPSWGRYDRLEDRLSSFNDKNESAHNNLRIELERKIEKASDDIKSELVALRENVEKKLPKQWYSWTIVALVAFVGIIWLLSYQEIAKLPNVVKEQERRIDKLENDLEQIPYKDTT